MAELTSKDRLQPALLDRLTDMEPHLACESRERRVISMRQLRDSVLRDLTNLLNASSLCARAAGEDGYALVEDSVLNYGMRDFTGRMLSGIDMAYVADEIAQTIRRFEPRILSHSLTVTPLDADHEERGYRMAFLIEGDLWAQPYPERLYVKTELDLEAGEVRVSAHGGALAR
jgi:type VI secretion system protein ImpF